MNTIQSRDIVVAYADMSKIDEIHDYAGYESDYQNLCKLAGWYEIVQIWDKTKANAPDLLQVQENLTKQALEMEADSSAVCMLVNLKMCDTDQRNLTYDDRIEHVRQEVALIMGAISTAFCLFDKNAGAKFDMLDKLKDTSHQGMDQSGDGITNSDSTGMISRYSSKHPLSVIVATEIVRQMQKLESNGKWSAAALSNIPYCLTAMV